MPLGAFKAALMGTAGTATTADVVLLSTTTASDDATVSITSGIDSTYGEYIFKFYNMLPVTGGTEFTFQVSIDGGSNYNVTATTTSFNTFNSGAGSTGLEYIDASDQAQGTAFQQVTPNIGTAASDGMSGELHLFNPSSTTYVKHFYSRTASKDNSDYIYDDYNAGYFNDTNDVNAIQFKMASGNIDSGKIKMWGVK